MRILRFRAYRLGDSIRPPAIFGLALVTLALYAGCGARAANPSGSASDLVADVQCRSSQLRLALGGPVSEPTGQRSLSLTLTNISPRSCRLNGYPAVELLDQMAHALPFDYRRAGDQVVTSMPPSPVDLAPGRRSFFTINKYRCDLGDLGIAATAYVTPPDATQLLHIALDKYPILGYCGHQDPGSTIDVSPLKATFPDTIRE